MVAKMEKQLSLETKEKRRLIRLRLDAGFGTDANINYAPDGSGQALWRGYRLLAKMFSGNRAKVLVQSVTQWFDAPTRTQHAKNQPATRQAGWVTNPHRYMCKTRQFAIRHDNYLCRVVATQDAQRPPDFTCCGDPAVFDVHHCRRR